MKAIVAVSTNNGIGVDGKMPWYIKDDFIHFKNITNGSLVFMGRKTYESIGKSLPNRTNVVLTTQKNLKTYSDSDIVVNSHRELEDVISKYDGDSFCIGGGKLYEYYIGHFTEIYLSVVNEQKLTRNKNLDFDTYFPRLSSQLYDIDDSIRKGVDGCSYYLLKRNNISDISNHIDFESDLVQTDINVFGTRFVISIKNTIMTLMCDVELMDYKHKGLITLFANIEADGSISYSDTKVNDDSKIVVLNNIEQHISLSICLSDYNNMDTMFTQSVIKLYACKNKIVDEFNRGVLKQIRNC